MQPRKANPPAQLQKPIQQELYAAIRKGDLKAIVRCLAQGADPNAPEMRLVKPSLDDTSIKDTEEGDTPLALAMKHGTQSITDRTREAIVRLLLDKGADVNRTRGASYAPLSEAMRFRHPRIALLLIQRGATPDQAALSFAINEQSPDLVTLLLDHGAKVNGIPNSTDYTPLMKAASYGADEVLALLLRRGANPNLKRGDRTALEIALIENNGSSEAYAVKILRRAGAKGRPWSALKAEIELSDLEINEEARKEEVELRELAKRYAALGRVTAEDSLVIEAVLLDILNYNGKDLWVSAQGHAKLDILIEDKTAKGPPNESQMNGELTIEQARDITREMRLNLIQRNYGQVSLVNNLKFTDRRIQIVQGTEKEWSGISPLLTKYPKARFSLTIYLPGYNAAKDRAVLRFYLAPSFHGASGTIFLVKDANGWRVGWRDFAYYA